MAAHFCIVGWPSESVLPDLSVMQGTFRLRRQASKWALFAEVVVDAAPSNDHEIVLGPDIFVWRRQAYGPDAGWGGPDDDAFGSAAVRSARYGLERLPAAFGKVRIRIVTIHDSPVDTTPPAVQSLPRTRSGKRWDMPRRQLRTSITRATQSSPPDENGTVDPSAALQEP